MRTLLLSCLLFSTFAIEQTREELEALKQLLGSRMPVIEQDNSPFVPNTFIGSFVFDLVTTNAEGSILEHVRTHFASSVDMIYIKQEEVVPEPGEITMLYDLRNKYEYMLGEEKNGIKKASKFRMKRLVLKAEEEMEVEEEELPTFTRTTETKLIEGQICTKMIAESSQGDMTGWFTESIVPPLLDLFNTREQMPMADSDNGGRSSIGFPMEFVLVDPETNTTTIGSAHKLTVGNAPAFYFSLDGYEIQDHEKIKAEIDKLKQDAKR